MNADLLKQAYCSLDRRVLGCFRIGFGCVLTYDLVRRALRLSLLYSNDGILPNHYLLYAPQAPRQFSIFTAFSTPAEVALAFSLTFLVYAAYTLGLWTRWAKLLALLCLTSLNARNLFFEDGGMSTLIATAVWTAFLPLGDRYSLDAVRRDARLRRIVDRVRARAALPERVRSPAVLAIIAQIVAIYTLNVVHKSGVSWHDGTAVHDVLWQNRVNTSFGNWLAFHEPSWFSPLATRMTLVIESLIPLLVVLPKFRVSARSLAFVLAVGLHGGIALLMTLGPFSYAMMALVSLMIPPEALGRVAELMPRARRLALYRLRARMVRAFARRSAVREFAEPTPARHWFRRFAARATAALAIVVMFMSTLELCHSNRAIRRFVQVNPPEFSQTFVDYLRMIQSWNMFAPNAPRDDGMVIVDARTAGGGHVDPFTGEPPDFDLGVTRPVPQPVMVCDYLFALRVGNERYRDQFAQYLQRWQELEHRPPSDRIVSYDVWWTNHETPPIGSVEPYDFKRELMFSGP